MNNMIDWLKCKHIMATQQLGTYAAGEYEKIDNDGKEKAIKKALWGNEEEGMREKISTSFI